MSEPAGILHLEFSASGEALIVVRAIRAAYERAFAIMCEEGAPDSMRAHTQKRLHDLANMVDHLSFEIAREEAEDRAGIVRGVGAEPLRWRS